MGRKLGGKNSKLKRVEIECNYCKKKFLVQPHNKNRQYCSLNCSNKEKHRDMSNFEYVLRIIKPKQLHATEAYGLTIPPSYVKQYNLLGKKFKIKVNKNGMFILYTQVK